MRDDLIYLCMQPEAGNSFWSRHIREGVEAAARQYKYNICLVDSRALSSDMLYRRTVIIAGNHVKWLSDAVNAIRSVEAEPVMVNASLLPHDAFRCSGVFFELEEMVRLCVSYLKRCGRKKIAFLGAGSASVTDKAKAAAFGSTQDVFYASGQLDSCVTDFANNLSSTGYDAVLCANDTVALYLSRLLKERGLKLPDDMFIIGMGNSYLGEMASPGITSVMFNYREMGMQAVYLYDRLSENPFSCHMTTSMPCRLIVRSSTGDISFADDRRAARSMPDMQLMPNEYFAGNDIQNIINMEALLQSCDATDRSIIRGLMDGMTVEEVADNVFMTPRGVRYRAAKLVRSCGFDSRQQLMRHLCSALGVSRTTFTEE